MPPDALYISRSGERFGPYSAQAVITMVAQGDVLSTDRICPSGNDVWLTLDDWAESVNLTLPWPQAPAPSIVGSIFCWASLVLGLLSMFTPSTMSYWHVDALAIAGLIAGVSGFAYKGGAKTAASFGILTSALGLIGFGTWV